MSNILEVCCGSYYDALQAQKGGARRIELNSALHLGGLTPSLATLLKIKEDTDLEVICMVRPRGAGFCYNDEDFEIHVIERIVVVGNCRFGGRHGGGRWGTFQSERGDFRTLGGCLQLAHVPLEYPFASHCAR